MAGWSHPQKMINNKSSFKPPSSANMFVGALVVAFRYPWQAILDELRVSVE